LTCPPKKPATTEPATLAQTAAREKDRPAEPVIQGSHASVIALMTGDPAQMKDAAAGTRPYIFKPFNLPI
jgi:hypothetical protein